MVGNCVNKYISKKTVRKTMQKQKEMQLREFEKKGRRAKKIHFYEALEELLR